MQLEERPISKSHIILEKERRPEHHPNSVTIPLSLHHLLPQGVNCLEEMFVWGKCHCLPPNCRCRICSSPNVLPITAIYKKCGGNTSSRWQEHYTQKAHFKYPLYPRYKILLDLHCHLAHETCKHMIYIHICTQGDQAK